MSSAGDAMRVSRGSPAQSVQDITHGSATEWKKQSINSQGSVTKRLPAVKCLSSRLVVKRDMFPLPSLSRPLAISSLRKL